LKADETRFQLIQFFMHRDPPGDNAIKTDQARFTYQIWNTHRH